MERVSEWTHELRTTDKPQATESLRSFEGYCCLGIGEELATGEGLEPLPSLSHASIKFVEWLGVDHRVERPHEQVGYAWDLQIDWPAELLPRGFMLGDITAAGLNDGCKLTFEQIADVVDYFGVRRAVWIST